MATTTDYYNMHCYPLGKHLWFGWIMSIKHEVAPYYFDNEKTALMLPTTWVDYVTFGFTKDAVTNKLRKQYEKLKNLHSKH